MSLKLQWVGLGSMHTTSCCLKQIERERRDKEVLVFGIGACA